jgi:hypothetical protein
MQASRAVRISTGMLRLAMSGRRRRRVSSRPSMPGRPMSMMAASNDSLRSTSSARSPLPTQSTAYPRRYSPSLMPLATITSSSTRSRRMVRPWNAQCDRIMVP